MNHDACHATETFYLAGQNLAGSYETDDEKLVRTRTNSWFDEYKNCNMNEIRMHSSLYNAAGYVQSDTIYIHIINFVEKNQ